MAESAIVTSAAPNMIGDFFGYNYLRPVQRTGILTTYRQTAPGVFVPVASTPYSTTVVIRFKRVLIFSRSSRLVSMICADPLMMERILLKSCAMPADRVPSAVIFWLWSNS